MTRAALILLVALTSGCTRREAPPQDAPAEVFETPNLPWVGEILGPAEDVRLFSLDASVHSDAPKDALQIGGWPALVKSGTLPPDERRAAKKALQSLIANVEGKIGSRCFMPHHGLVAVHDGHRLEVAICLTCDNAEFFLDGKKKDMIYIGGDGMVLDDLLGNPPRVGGR